jgi:hypothetical protein
MKLTFWNGFKQFYAASAENRIQIKLFLGFVIIPVIGMTMLYIYVNLFLI